MWQTVLCAIALVFVFEGVLPALCPHCWRKTLLKLITMSNRSLHLLGLASMIFGALIIYFIKNFFMS